jgi:hypothetical protein
MQKFRTLLATALLTLPVVTLASTQTEGANPGVRVEASTSLTSCCMYLVAGRWFCFPC